MAWGGCENNSQRIKGALPGIHVNLDFALCVTSVCGHYRASPAACLHIVHNKALQKHSVRGTGPGPLCQGVLPLVLPR